jgi:hypothetical protein
MYTYTCLLARETSVLVTSCHDPALYGLPPRPDTQKARKLFAHLRERLRRRQRLCSASDCAGKNHVLHHRFLKMKAEPGSSTGEGK